MNLSRVSPIYIPIKLKIPAEEVACFQVELTSKKYLIVIYRCSPQESPLRLEIPPIDQQSTLTISVCLFLKNEIKRKKTPSYYHKKTKAIVYDE